MAAKSLKNWLYCFSVTKEDKKTILYTLSQEEAKKITEKILDLMAYNPQWQTQWHKIDDFRLEYRHEKLKQLKAMYYLKYHSLIYLNKSFKWL